MAKISINDIDQIYSENSLQKSAIISKELEMTIKSVLDMILDKKVNHQSISDLKNLLEFR